MKKLIAAAAAATLCACGPAEKAEPAPEAAEAAPADVPDGGSVAGSFTVTNADGSTTSWTNNEDGTYSATMADRTEASGTYMMTGRDYCYDPAGDGEGLDEVCLAFSNATEDGSWVSTRPDGSTANITRNAEQAQGDGEAVASE